MNCGKRIARVERTADTYYEVNLSNVNGKGNGFLNSLVVRIGRSKSNDVVCERTDCRRNIASVNVSKLTCTAAGGRELCV